MKNTEKLKVLSKLVLNDKDYQLILKFIECHDFDSFSEIIKSEIKKEYKLCIPEKMTDRYCMLQEISFILSLYDVNTYFDEKCINYEEE